MKYRIVELNSGYFIIEQSAYRPLLNDFFWDKVQNFEFYFLNKFDNEKTFPANFANQDFSSFEEAEKIVNELLIRKKEEKRVLYLRAHKQVIKEYE